MAIFKCIGCGRELISDDSNALCVCVYCGTTQPVPQAGCDHPQPRPNPEGASHAAAPEGSNVQALLDRGFMALEDSEWEKADGFFEQALNSDARLSGAYLGKLMAELKVCRQEDLKDCAQPFDNRTNYQKVLRFGKPALVQTLKGYNSQILMRNESDRQIRIYGNASRMMENAKTEKEFKDAAGAFSLIPNYQDAQRLAGSCLEKAEECRKDAIWTYANSLMTGENIEAYETAIRSFRQIPGWKDADAKIGACRQVIDGLKAKEDADRLKAEKHRKKFLIIVIILLSTAAVCAAGWFLATKVILPNSKYNDGVRLMDEGKYSDAIEAFEALDGYKDSEDQILACKYAQAAALRDEGKYKDAIEAFEAIGEHKDAKAQIIGILNELMQKEPISAGGYHTVAVNADGTVVAVGRNEDGRCNIGGWTDIVAVSAGYHHTVGLKKDGTVVAVGNDGDGQCDVEGWTNMIAVSAGELHTVGLKADGTVVAVGNDGDGQCDVEGWTDIVAVSAGCDHTVGLKKDGTVVAVGWNGAGLCEVEDWTDIVAVSAGYVHTVGLKKDGTVVAVGLNYYGQCEVADWTDIVAVSAGYAHTVGLKADGTVVAVGYNDYGQCEVEGWTDIVAVSAGYYHTVGLKADGTVVAVGWNIYGQCNVEDWTGIVSAAEGQNPAASPEPDTTVDADDAHGAVGAEDEPGDVEGRTDIAAVSAGVYHTVALKKNGTVVAVGNDGDGQCEVEDWTDIKVPG